MLHVIDRIVEHGAAVKEFHLRRADDAPLAPWRAGSHIVLRFADAQGRDHERHYSLVGAPGQAQAYRIAVQREEGGRGGSRSLHDEFAAGGEVEVDGPFDSFPLAPAGEGARTLLVGGGIGITPLISLAHAAQAQGRAFTLHHLVRSAGRRVLQDELALLPAAALAWHVSSEAGRADLDRLLGPYGEGDVCHACGPAPLLQALAEAAARQGWPAKALHVESFGARARQGDAPLTVELTLSQMTVEVAPGTSILEALIAADVFVSYECRRGECGSCYAQVLEGEPLHRDVCLTPSMRAQGMCTCVSWAARERLVLEL
ncbi:PDR/VanB family oxidoreductase [Herbaspirillum sp. WKF16]|uniref:PDR/VanB family oxidoreductase n=1 Tax=Herbaspirillum sp. WKF16 TaxID=3028312 RepID=UPI0023A93711|nr:PDR/VanB family oxidoreductase [Herbaspirillum sp. WKF16]WDZ97003.1 PDR/VanB family oxidoreductase [Herbaspirillum sp. WKF16]